MKIIGVIPARYASSRFPGKPLADICGKPMIWWVYNQAIKTAELNDVCIATDDERILDTCGNLGLNAIMTSADCKTPANRLYEVSYKIEAELYIEINGDEPLIKPEIIACVIPKDFSIISDQPYVGSLCSVIKNPIDVIDPTNVKVVVGNNGCGLYISRSPIPFPKGSLDFIYRKFVGVCIFNKSALDFYNATPRSIIEAAEDNDLLRFIENGVSVHFTDVEGETVSVDTQKDLEMVRQIILQRKDQ